MRVGVVTVNKLGNLTSQKWSRVINHCFSTRWAQAGESRRLIHISAKWRSWAAQTICYLHGGRSPKIFAVCAAGRPLGDQSDGRLFAPGCSPPCTRAVNETLQKFSQYLDKVPDWTWTLLSHLLENILIAGSPPEIGMLVRKVNHYHW